jgi:hypothetical protein
LTEAVVEVLKVGVGRRGSGKTITEVEAGGSLKGDRSSRRVTCGEKEGREEKLTVGHVGEVVMAKTRRRCSTQGLMRRRPGRARLTADRGSQGTNTPDVEPSPFATRM